jgi:hypothetical protein
MLQSRLAELEAEHARLAGRASGLHVALAEAEERTARARRDLGSRRRQVKVKSARALGGFVWVVLILGAMWWIFRCVDQSRHGGARRDVELMVVESDRGGLRARSRCVASIDEDGEGCEASLRCGEAAIYRGEGVCSFGPSSVEFWDRELDSTPRFVVLEHERRAILREPGALVVLTPTSAP